MFPRFTLRISCQGELEYASFSEGLGFHLLRAYAECRFSCVIVEYTLFWYSRAPQHSLRELYAMDGSFNLFSTSCGSSLLSMYTCDVWEIAPLARAQTQGDELNRTYWSPFIVAKQYFLFSEILRQKTLKVAGAWSVQYVKPSALWNLFFTIRSIPDFRLSMLVYDISFRLFILNGC